MSALRRASELPQLILVRQLGQTRQQWGHAFFFDNLRADPICESSNTALARSVCPEALSASKSEQRGANLRSVRRAWSSRCCMQTWHEGARGATKRLAARASSGPVHIAVGELAEHVLKARHVLEVTLDLLFGHTPSTSSAAYRSFLSCCADRVAQWRSHERRRAERFHLAQSLVRGSASHTAGGR